MWGPALAGPGQVTGMVMLARLRIIALGLVCLLASATMQAQQAPAKPFEPVEGLAGKDVPWVPTPNELVQKMLDIAKVTPKDFVIDLGSGDGRNVIAAAKRGATALGVEYNPDLVALSKKRAADAVSPARRRSCRATCTSPISRRQACSPCF